MNNYNNDLCKSLSNSKFRSKFHLTEKDIKYVNEKGLSTIEKHARDFINKRLKPEIILNDGKQTPMKGHPVFIAEHATATCCRQCLYKWHKITPNHELTDEEIDYIIKIIMIWITKQISAK